MFRFKSVSNDVKGYLVSTYCDINDAVQLRVVNRNFYNLIDDGIIRKIIQMRHHKPLKENLKELRKMRKKELNKEVKNKLLRNCLWSYTGLIFEATHKRCTLFLWVKDDSDRVLERVEVHVNTVLSSEFHDFVVLVCKEAKHYLAIRIFVRDVLDAHFASNARGLCGNYSLKTSRKAIQKRLKRHMSNIIIDMKWQRVRLFANTNICERGILYEFPNSVVYGSKFDRSLRVFDAFPYVQCYSRVCNFITGVDYTLIDVHAVEFGARGMNKYELSLFKKVDVGVTSNKTGVKIRDKKESINIFKRKFHFNLWKRDFPWGCFDICGSSALFAIDPSFDESIYPVSDLDCFCVADITRAEWILRVRLFIEILKRRKYKVSEVTHDSRNIEPRPGIVNTLSHLSRLKYKVLFSTKYEPIFFDFVWVTCAGRRHAINNFDIEISQVCFDGIDFWCTNAFVEAINTNTFISSNCGGVPQDLKVQLTRPYKYLTRGYDWYVPLDMDVEQVEKTIKSHLKEGLAIKVNTQINRFRPYGNLCKISLDMFGILNKFLMLKNV